MKKVFAIACAVLLLTCVPNAFADWGENTGDRTIPVYSKMDMYQDPIFFIPVGERFTASFMGQGWYLVSYRGIQGYILKGAYLNYTWTLNLGDMLWGDEGVVICKSMSIRDGRSTGAKLLTTVLNGDKLRILSEEGDWFQVRYVDRLGKETIGWARAAYIVKNPINVTTIKAAQAYCYPSLSAKCVGELAKGTQLIVIGQYGDFYCVNLRQASAFVLARDCAIYTDEGEVGLIMPGESLALGVSTETSSR